MKDATWGYRQVEEGLMSVKIRRVGLKEMMSQRKIKNESLCYFVLQIMLKN